ncbi:polysaccharide biosynthesis tyrosine autokinase [Thermodesulfobacteriota bacterium]
MMFGKRFRKDKTDGLNDLFLDKFPLNSRFSESYRSLRTNIHFSFLEKELRSILITSAGAAEGKSLTTANLGYTMAQSGKTVLMIDADLRKPMLSRLSTNHNSKGLSGLLSGSFNTEIQSGSLSQYGVSDLFWLISFQKRTGRLQLTEENEKISAYFLNGELVDVQWLTRPEEKKLANLLVQEKVLPQEQANLALGRAKNTGQKLGFVLINMGLLNENTLAGYITLHMMEGLRIALQFKTGSFSFAKLPGTHFEQSSFDPADLPQLYKQAIIGEEKLHFLQKEINAAIIETHIENLFLLPSGPRPPKPAELLGSDRMSFLLSNLYKRFDRVIIDSPPILVTTDALLIGSQTDGVLLIVKAGFMKREAVKKAVDQIERAQANIIGVALNQVDVKAEGYYKYYSKYYEERE